MKRAQSQARLWTSGAIVALALVLPFAGRWYTACISAIDALAFAYSGVYLRLYFRNRRVHRAAHRQIDLIMSGIFHCNCPKCRARSA